MDEKFPELAARSHPLTGRLEVLRELTGMLGRISAQERAELRVARGGPGGGLEDLWRRLRGSRGLGRRPGA
jgi:hypothetical protein